MPYIPQVKIGDTTYKIKDQDCWDQQMILSDAVNNCLDNQMMLSNNVNAFEELIAEETINLWQEGDISVPADPGYVHITLKKPIPAGTYLLSAVITTDAPNTSAIGFSVNETPSGTLVYANLDHTGIRVRAGGLFTFTQPMLSVRVLSSNNVANSSGHSAVWSNIQLEATNDPLLYNGYVAPYNAVDMTARNNVDKISHEQIVVSRIVHYDGFDVYILDKGLPAGKYTLLLNISSTENDNTRPSIVQVGGANYREILAYDGLVTRDEDHHIIITVTDNRPFVFWLFASDNVGHSSGKTLTVNKFALYNGEIISKDENFDCSEAVNYMLNTYGVCQLENGEYTLKRPITMPSKSTLVGRDDKTQLKLGTTIDKSFSAANESGTSFIAFNSTIGSAWSGPYPEGLYRYTINVSTQSEDRPRFRPCKETNYSASQLLANVTITPDTDVSGYFYASEPMNSIFVFGGASTQYTGPVTVNSLSVELISVAVYMGDHSTVRDLEFVGSASDISLTGTIGKRNGILWHGRDIRRYGIVENCRIHGFDGAGILGVETGQDTNSGMMISNCGVYNNTVGIYFSANSEFNKICNSTITYNYYGYYNRGGNNIISNCGVDSNVVGIQIDMNEGANNGHGNITGCTINHSDSNNGYGIVIQGTGRMLVSNCNLYYSDILLENTNGNTIANCGFGSMSEIEIVGGGCSIIEGCMMRSQDNTITITNNNKVQVLNCFDRNGNAITPISGQ